MAVNLIDNEQIHVIQNGSDITLDIQEDALKNKNVVVDSIRSKNIFNKANILNNAYLNISNQNKIVYDSNSISGYAKCKPNTTYTISKIVSAPFIVATCSTTPAIDTTIQQGINNDSASSITITTNSSAQYIVFWFYHTQYSTESYNDIINSIQVEEGTTATAYSPYQNLTGEENYSTGEQVIGTWINGKPLYRKVFTDTMPQVQTDGTFVVKTIDISSLNTDVVFFDNPFFMGYPGGSRSIQPLPTLNQNNMSQGALISVWNTNIEIRSNRTTWNTFTSYVPMCYTKTTD